MTDSLLSNAAEWRLNWSCALSLFFRIFPLGGCEDSARRRFVVSSDFPYQLKDCNCVSDLKQSRSGRSRLEGAHNLGKRWPITC